MDLLNHRKRKLLAAADARLGIKRCRRDLMQERQVFSALKNKAGLRTNSKREMENIVKDFYKELYSPISSQPLPNIRAITEELPPILSAEVRTAIDTTKPGTAPEPDNISVDLLKAGGYEFYKLLAEKFTTYLREKRIPYSWLKARTSAVLNDITAKLATLSQSGNAEPLNLLVRLILNHVDAGTVNAAAPEYK
ncbi:hypothetical protein OESDEN_03704 [Oesophagostomum dentatum]|uniref:Uncharacterized protein n=1 Tax=Oesophagostomum dentatum TaxID=61180 RepID=A0A0B1TGE7_OESDE|nr:hypothetical protein OESDEN_03704 [Oesophagostomum dentatum]